MRKNDKRSLPPSGRDRIIRTRIMRKREPERRSTKSFAQDRGSTDFLRMVLRAHNASARTIGRGRKRILRRENSAKSRRKAFLRECCGKNLGAKEVREVRIACSDRKSKGRQWLAGRRTKRTNARAWSCGRA